MSQKVFTADMLYGPAAGPEIDGTPVQIPSGLKPPLTMEQRIARFVRHELSSAAQNRGVETFEEANDFDIPDDPVDPSTPFEEFFDPAIGFSVTPDELRRYDSEYRSRYLAIQADAISREERQAKFDEAIRKARTSGAEGGHKPPPSAPEEPPKTP